MPEIALVLVSYNTRELTVRAVAAARAAVRGLEAVLVVADNGSTDGTPAAVRATAADVKVLVSEDNPGYGVALNRAFARFPGAYLCALNADVLLEPGCLGTLRDFLEGHPECGLAGPSFTGRDGRPQPSCKRLPTLGFALGELFGLHALAPGNRWNRHFYYVGEHLRGATYVETVSGAAMLIRGEAFRRVGGFDEGFRLYFEETDLCRRLRGAGYHVAFVPEARAIHWHGASTLQTSARQVEYYLSYRRFMRKHGGPGAARILSAAIALATAGRMLLLPLKYPPLSKRGAAALAPKLGACRRLLCALGRPEAALPAGARHP